MVELQNQLRLYLVTDTQLCAQTGVVETVRCAVAGGVTMVQLRDKDATTGQRIASAIALKQVLVDTNVPLLVNDDLIAAVEADGAHIGQGDMAPEKAREILGRDKILGLSCETDQAVLFADPTVVDYLGIGPVFGTSTKTDHAQPIGFNGLARLVALSRLPTVAIGGLKSMHRHKVRATGANGMAVVSAICGQADPYAAARAFGIPKTEHPT